VVVVDDATVGTAVESADAMVTSVPDAPLVILVADCVVVGLYDPVRGAAGIAHAGWRGTLGGIATATLRTMGQTFGTQAADVVAAIGPSIGPCCYVVGPEVVDAFYAEHPDIAPEVLGVPDFASAGSFNGAVNEDRMVLDLWKANSLQLEAAGVPAGQIDVAGACTACDTLHFFSHRAENGRTGRFAGVMMLHKGTRRPW
jgi:YfiH family protein